MPKRRWFANQYSFPASNPQRSLLALALSEPSSARDPSAHQRSHEYRKPPWRPVWVYKVTEKQKRDKRRQADERVGTGVLVPSRQEWRLARVLF